MMNIAITTGNLDSIVWHLNQGQDNGNINRDALALFLSGVSQMLREFGAVVRATRKMHDEIQTAADVGFEVVHPPHYKEIFSSILAIGSQEADLEDLTGWGKGDLLRQIEVYEVEIEQLRGALERIKSAQDLDEAVGIAYNALDNIAG